jgi:hypothetical protein
MSPPDPVSAEAALRDRNDAAALLADDDPGRPVAR